MARKVIKGETPRDGLAPAPLVGERKVIDREVFRAQQEAEAIRREAESQAAARRERGQAEAEATYREAVLAGVEDAMAEVARGAVEAYLARAQRFRDATQDCLTIALRICTKILDAELRLDETRVRAIVQEFIERAAGKRRAVVRLHPERLERARTSAPRAFARADALPELVIESDPAIDPDRAVVRTDVGDLEIRADAAVAIVERLVGR